VTAAKEQIGARVDALAEAHEGDTFVSAVERLAEELGPEGRPLLQQVLLERAADEEDFQEAVRRRFAEKGWTRRTLARLERLWRDDRADTIAAALKAGPEGEAEVERETNVLRDEPGRAALVLDELSRHESRRVRAWVPGAAAEILGDGGERLVLSLTRDRDREVRDAALAALLELGPEAARAVVPDLRRRLHSADAAERIAAAWALAQVGDGASLGVIEERAETAELPDERSAALAASHVLRGNETAVVAGLRGHDHDDLPALAAAARILGTEATLDALRDAAEAAPDNACRAACRAELDKVREEA